jgi:hypothetical protein
MEHNGYFFNLNFEKKKSKILFAVLKSSFIVSNVLFFKPRSVQKKMWTNDLALALVSFNVCRSFISCQNEWAVVSMCFTKNSYVF